jgi:hypothetical protein
MNALKHGLATPEPILLEGEDEAAFTTLHETLIEENEPESATETQLVHRLAVTFWKQARADRLEAKLLANTDPPRFITSEGIEPGDPEAFFDLRRFNAIRGYQAQLSREVSRCLSELRRLKAGRVGEAEPAAAIKIEPRHSAVAAALAHRTNIPPIPPELSRSAPSPSCSSYSHSMTGHPDDSLAEAVLQGDLGRLWPNGASSRLPRRPPSRASLPTAHDPSCDGAALTRRTLAP